MERINIMKYLIGFITALILSIVFRLMHIDYFYAVG